jgi:hypothetical protein
MMAIDRRKYLYRIKRLEIKSWLKYLMIEGKSVVDYVLGELASGTDITIDNTVEKKFYKFNIKGNSTQNGTPSPSSEVLILSAGDENLFDGEITTGSVINSSGGLTPSALGWYSNNFYPVKPNTSYTLTYNSTDYTFAMRIAQYTENKTFSTRPVTNSSPYTFTTGNDIYFIKLSGGTGDSNIQLKSTVGTISEKIVNKNLFDKNNVRNGYRLGSDGTYYGASGYSASEPIIVKPNTTYYRNKGLTTVVPICTYKKDGTFIARLTSGNTITTPADCYFIRTAVKNEDLDTTQLEIGSTATTYVAYQEQTYTIPVQQPMRSIGTVRDEFIQINGEWKERHNIGYIEADGTGEVAKDSDSGYIRYELRGIIPLMKQNSSRTEILSNYFHFLSSGKEVGGCFSFWIYSGTIFIYPEQTITTVDDMKAWLNANKPKFCYLLQTPIDLPCTAEQIAILENLPTSYNEQTNIYSLDVTPAFLEVQAYVKKEEVIEND